MSRPLKLKEPPTQIVSSFIQMVSDGKPGTHEEFICAKNSSFKNGSYRLYAKYAGPMISRRNGRNVVFHKIIWFADDGALQGNRFLYLIDDDVISSYKVFTS